jgi:cobalamin biosynthesis Mg chelatase CobN
MDRGLKDETTRSHLRGLHMKRIACLLSLSLILLGAFHGVAAAQQLSGLTGPLDGNSDPLDKVKNPKTKEKVDKTKEVVDEAVPGAEEPAKDVTNEVEDSADNVVEDSSEVPEDSGGTAGSVADEPTQGRTTPSDMSASGSTDSRTKLTGSTNPLSTGSKDASGADPSDTDTVAAAGNTIESAPENDEQLAAPEADGDESEGSVLSSTGAQIMVWLVLACLLIAIGAALVRRRRTGSHA